MSKVISFRLNPENPQEAKALTILDSWLSQGFSTRHALTEALLQLDPLLSKTTDNETLNDLSRQIKQLLDNIECDVTSIKLKEGNASKKKLSDGFITSVLKAAKPGFRAE